MMVNSSTIVLQVIQGPWDVVAWFVGIGVMALVGLLTLTVIVFIIEMVFDFLEWWFSLFP